MIRTLTSAATVSLNAEVEHRVEGSQIFQITPGETMTINAVPDGLPGQQYELHVVTSGTSSYTITFGTNFKSTGTLASGTADAKRFVVSFTSTGTTLVETSRTAAM